MKEKWWFYLFHCAQQKQNRTQSIGKQPVSTCFSPHSADLTIHYQTCLENESSTASFASKIFFQMTQTFARFDCFECKYPSHVRDCLVCSQLHLKQLSCLPSVIPTSALKLWQWKVLGLKEGIQPFIPTRGHCYHTHYVLLML